MCLSLGPTGTADLSAALHKQFLALLALLLFFLLKDLAKVVLKFVPSEEKIQRERIKCKNSFCFLMGTLSVYVERKS